MRKWIHRGIGYKRVDRVRVLVLSFGVWAVILVMRDVIINFWLINIIAAISIWGIVLRIILPSWCLNIILLINPWLRMIVLLVPVFHTISGFSFIKKRIVIQFIPTRTSSNSHSWNQRCQIYFFWGTLIEWMSFMLVSYSFGSFSFYRVIFIISVFNFLLISVVVNLWSLVIWRSCRI